MRSMNQAGEPSADRSAGQPRPRADQAGALETLGRSSGPASLILSSLADGAKHGYALTKDIEVFAGVRLAPGTLYEALSRLEAQGMIEAVESHDRRRPYRLTAADAARALRLLRWYPRGWRARYGDEFAELLIAEFAEHGPSRRRALNVAATGLRARLAGAGLAGHPLDPAAAARAGLATLASCVAAAGLAGGVMWAQLAIGLQWSVPGDDQLTQAMDLMSAALLVLAVLAVLAGLSAHARVLPLEVITCSSSARSAGIDPEQFEEPGLEGWIPRSEEHTSELQSQ